MLASIANRAPSNSVEHLFAERITGHLPAHDLPRYRCVGVGSTETAQSGSSVSHCLSILSMRACVRVSVDRGQDTRVCQHITRRSMHPPCSILPLGGGESTALFTQSLQTFLAATRRYDPKPATLSSERNVSTVVLSSHLVKSNQPA